MATFVIYLGVLISLLPSAIVRGSPFLHVFNTSRRKCSQNRTLDIHVGAINCTLESIAVSSSTEIATVSAKNFQECAEAACPTQLQFENHDFKPDRRPVVHVGTWNGCYEGMCGSDGNKYGFARMWKDPETAVDNLINVLQELYAKGFRKFVAWLPAGNQPGTKMSSAQWWTMGARVRDDLELKLKPFLAAHPDIHFGPYVGWPLGLPDRACSLNMEPFVIPDLNNFDDICALHRTAAPWHALGAELLWYDWVSGSADIFIEVYRNRSFGQKFVGGEAVPLELVEPEGETNAERCAATIAFGQRVTFGPKCVYYIPKSEYTEKVPWIGTYAFHTARNYDGWPSWDALTTEIGIYWTGHTPCAGRRDVNLDGIPLDGSCAYPPFDDKHAYELIVDSHHRGFVQWFQHVSGDATKHAMEAAMRLQNFGNIECAGDFNYDGVVNMLDIWVFRERWSNYSGKRHDTSNQPLAFWHGDVNDDGCVDKEDKSLFEKSLWNSDGACHSVSFGGSRNRAFCCEDPIIYGTLAPSTPRPRLHRRQPSQRLGPRPQRRQPRQRLRSRPRPRPQRQTPGQQPRRPRRRRQRQRPRSKKRKPSRWKRKGRAR